MADLSWWTPQPTMYAIYHRTCGHVAGAPNNRTVADGFVAALAAKGQFAWRIRVATDDDLAALIAGVRCGTCAQDGQTVEAVTRG